MLEKHVNLVDLEEGPDVPHSLDEARFESMIVHLRNGLGPHMKSYTQFRSEHIARPVSTQKIEPGQPLKGKFKYLRRQMPSPYPNHNLDLDKLTARTEIPKGTVIMLSETSGWNRDNNAT